MRRGRGRTAFPEHLETELFEMVDMCPHHPRGMCSVILNSSLMPGLFHSLWMSFPPTVKEDLRNYCYSPRLLRDNRALSLQGGRALSLQGGRALSLQGGRALSLQGDRALSLRGDKMTSPQGGETL